MRSRCASSRAWSWSRAPPGRSARRGTRRRVRGTGPVGARFGALAALGAAAWAPWAVARFTGLPLGVACLSEALAMALAYGGVLAASAHLLETRREPLLAALARDE